MTQSATVYGNGALAQSADDDERAQRPEAKALARASLIPPSRTPVQLLRGTTRFVLLVGRWAVKIPRFTRWRMFLHGLLANMQERQWAGFDERLCPVVASVPGGWVVVMRRAAPLPNEIWAAWDVTAMTNFLHLEGGGKLPVRYKRCSLGVVDGQVVAVDYGS